MPLTHIDKNGKAVMVDITAKKTTKRSAQAGGYIKTTVQVISLIKKNLIAKGDVLAVAQIAGILGAKQTPYLIPLCHPLLISNAKVNIHIVGSDRLCIKSEISCTGQTGPDVEALTTVAVACLTIYDMCKAVDKTMQIESICLLEKRGGKTAYVRKT